MLITVGAYNVTSSNVMTSSFFLLFRTLYHLMLADGGKYPSYILLRSACGMLNGNSYRSVVSLSEKTIAYNTYMECSILLTSCLIQGCSNLEGCKHLVPVLIVTVSAKTSL